MTAREYPVEPDAEPDFSISGPTALFALATEGAAMSDEEVELWHEHFCETLDAWERCEAVLDKALAQANRDDEPDDARRGCIEQLLSVRSELRGVITQIAEQLGSHLGFGELIVGLLV